MIKKKLKILFVSRDKYPPFRVDVAVLFGKEMVRKGHHIDWVLQSEDNCGKSYKEKWGGGIAWVGLTTNGGSLLKRIKKHLLGFVHNIVCVRLVFINRYDGIQIKDRFISALPFLLAAKFVGIKCFYWLSYPFGEASLYKLKDKTARYPIIYFCRGIAYKVLLYKIIMRYSDHVFVQSDQMKFDIESEGIPAQKMTAIPMGYDEEELVNDSILPIRKDKNRPAVVYIGTLNRLRKIDFVIKMFLKVVRAVPNAELYLVGDADADEDIGYLKQVALELGISNSVRFTGFLERHRVFRIVKMADVCISPFYPTPILNSTSPTKLIEYMALGKAVVANDHPEQKSVIDQSGGGLCVPYVEKDFSDAVVYLLNNSLKREQCGKMGKSWVKNHRSYRNIASSVERAYYEIVNQQ